MLAGVGAATGGHKAALAREELDTAIREARAAGMPRSRRPYDLRHSYASWALAAGVPSFDVARYMGTSMRMLDLTYGHLVKGSETAAAARLDAFTASPRERLGQESAT